MKPALVAVAHGTRDLRGPEVIRSLLTRVALKLPGVDVFESYVELVDPNLSTALDRLTGPGREAVVVPLLLSTGYHIKSDVPQSVAASSVRARMVGPLGPHPLLAKAMVQRLAASGADARDPVVLVAAGSSDPGARADVARAARLLASARRGPVSFAFASQSGPTVAEAISRHRRHGGRQVAVAPYLLAPGRFASEIEAQARSAGASRVAEVLGAHPAVAALVGWRYAQGSGRSRQPLHRSA
jgi:sirohydrochlorin ferrochelatase